MKVQRKVRSPIFKESPLSTRKQDGRFVVIDHAGACDLPVSYSEREFDSIYEIIEE